MKPVCSHHMGQLTSAKRKRLVFTPHADPVALGQAVCWAAGVRPQTFYSAFACGVPNAGQQIPAERSAGKVSTHLEFGALPEGGTKTWGPMEGVLWALGVF